jgi:hypothetical protein
MKTTVLIFLTLTVSAAIAWPSLESDEYTDNNLVDSMLLEDNTGDEPTDYIQM